MTLHRSLPLLELRSQPQGLLEGYAAVFGGIDSYNDTIDAGAFRASLAQHKAAGTSPVMLWSHKSDAPIGRWTSILENARGLQVSGQLNMRTTAGQEAFHHLHAGDVSGLSIGLMVGKNGVEHHGSVRHLKAIDLAEISIVSMPADSAARITAVKSQVIKPATIRGLEQALEEIGYSRREARSIAATGFTGLAAPDNSLEIISAFKAATQYFTKA